MSIYTYVTTNWDLTALINKYTELQNKSYEVDSEFWNLFRIFWEKENLKIKHSIIVLLLFILFIQQI